MADYVEPTGSSDQRWHGWASVRPAVAFSSDDGRMVAVLWGVCRMGRLWFGAPQPDGHVAWRRVNDPREEAPNAP